MYQVTYLGIKRRTASYQTLQRAQSAIRAWLKKQQMPAQAILYAPNEQPVSYTCISQLPETIKKQTDFYLTRSWLSVRARAFERYGNQCKCCGAGPAQGVVLHVDHVKPRSLFPELALDVENLQILCDACNLGKSNHSQSDWR